MYARMYVNPCRRSFLLCGAFSMVVACKGGSDDPKPTVRESTATSSRPALPPTNTTLEIEWTKDDKFQVKGRPLQKGEVDIFEAAYRVSLYGFPTGTKWSALDKSGATASSVMANIRVVDMVEKLGTLPADATLRHKAKLDPEATLTLEVPGGAKVDIKLPPSDAGLSAEKMLDKIDSGPVLFGKEPPDAKPMQSIILVDSVHPKLFGRAETLRDVDALAKAQLLADAKGTKTCTGYKGNGGKDIVLNLKETEVVIYERRTGKVAAKKVFPPNDKCPEMLYRSSKETSVEKTDSRIPSDAVEAWLKSQIKP